LKYILKYNKRIFIWNVKKKRICLYVTAAIVAVLRWAFAATVCITIEDRENYQLVIFQLMLKRHMIGP